VRRAGSDRPSAGVVLLAVLLLALPTLVLAQGPLGGLRRGMQSQALLREGRVLYEAGNYMAARDRLAEAITLDESNDEANALLGWSHYRVGDYRAAAIVFKTVLRRQPSWEGLYDGLGWSRFRLGRYHLAIEAFQAALDLAPDHSDALIGMGGALFELGRYEGAIPPLERGLRGMKTAVGKEALEAPAARARLAWSLYYAGRPVEALGAFERALRAAPRGAGLYNGIGWCQLKLGDRQRARAAFERALALQPGYDDAVEGLRQARG